MIDNDTRDKLVDYLKEWCPLRTALKPNKACPYFGMSRTCRDCVYDWVTICLSIGDILGARRSAYEAEVKKTKVLAGKVEKMEPVVDALVQLAGALRVFEEENSGKGDDDV